MDVLSKLSALFTFLSRLKIWTSHLALFVEGMAAWAATQL
jgi:hypothetical protein